MHNRLWSSESIVRQKSQPLTYGSILHLYRGDNGALFEKGDRVGSGSRFHDQLKKFRILPSNLNHFASKLVKMLVNKYDILVLYVRLLI